MLVAAKTYALISEYALICDMRLITREYGTNARANFLMTENIAYQRMEDGPLNMHALRLLWLIARFRYNVETKSEI